MHTEFNGAQCGQLQAHKQRTHLCYFCSDKFFGAKFYLATTIHWNILLF